MSFVSIARLVKTRGIRGEVSAELLTDFPSRFKTLKRVVLCRGSESFEEDLEGFWFYKERVVLKFKGRDRPHEVEELVGCELQVAPDQRHPIPADTFYDDDLIGCVVVEEGRALGTVREIYRARGAVHNLVVCQEDGQEFMIPMSRAFVVDVDLEGLLIAVTLPEGLVEQTLVQGVNPKPGRDS